MNAILERRAAPHGPPDLGCVLHLPGIPGGSGSIHDRSVYGGVGAVVGAGWARTPGGLWGLSFDGQDDRVTFPAATQLDITGTISVEAWLKPAGGQSLPACIVVKTGGDPWYFYALRLLSSKFKFQASIDGSDYTAAADAAYTADTWAHVVGTYDGSELRIYLNAVEQSDSPAVSGSIDVGSDVLSIGAWKASSEFYEGEIALVSVHNRALTSLEIAGRFERQKESFGAWPS